MDRLQMAIDLANLERGGATSRPSSRRPAIDVGAVTGKILLFLSKPTTGHGLAFSHFRFAPWTVEQIRVLQGKVAAHLGQLVENRGRNWRWPNGQPLDGIEANLDRSAGYRRHGRGYVLLSQGPRHALGAEHPHVALFVLILLIELTQIDTRRIGVCAAPRAFSSAPCGRIFRRKRSLKEYCSRTCVVRVGARRRRAATARDVAVSESRPRASRPPTDSRRVRPKKSALAGSRPSGQRGRTRA
jgi:hypothetical protein